MDHAVRDASADFTESLCAEYRKHNQIDPALYERYRVKRGLRNVDDTGVVTGVTQIGNVMGYYVQDDERIPVPGKLVYRGIDVEELINGFVSEGRFGFEETVCLFLFDVLLTRAQLTVFEGLLSAYRALPPMFTGDMTLRALSPDVMDKLARSVLALYSYDRRPDDMFLPNQLRQVVEFTARVSVIVAHAFAAKRHYHDNGPLYLRRSQEGSGAVQNFLYSVRHDNRYTGEEARLLDLYPVFHTEHGGDNNSAFACWVFSSPGIDVYSSTAAVVGSLKGPCHGGTNKRVIEMFGHIEVEVSDWTDDDTVRDYLGRPLRKKVGDRSGLTYDMGHAIHTLSDLRTVLLRRFARSLIKTKGMLDESESFERTEHLIPEMLRTVRGEEKVVCVNMSLFSELVYKITGIPMEFYTPLFAVARVMGWCTHHTEEVCQPVNHTIRPVYKTMASIRVFVSLGQGRAMNQVTKRAPEVLLKKLLPERPLDRITVTSITEDCGIDCMTFYYHLRDIYDPVEQVYQEDIQRIPGGERTCTTWQGGFRRILGGLIDNGPFILNIYYSVRRKQIETSLSQVVHGLLMGAVEELGPRGEVREEDEAFLIDFYECAFVGLVLNWIRTGIKGELTKLAHRIELVVSGSLARTPERLWTDPAHQAGPFD